MERPSEFYLVSSTSRITRNDRPGRPFWDHAIGAFNGIRKPNLPKVRAKFAAFHQKMASCYPPKSGDILVSPLAETAHQKQTYYPFRFSITHLSVVRLSFEASMVAAHDLEEASALWLEEKPTAPLKRVGELPPMPDKPMRMTIKFS